MATLRARTEAAHTRLDDQGDQLKRMNENMQRARDALVHDREQIERIKERSIQNEVDIIYLSSGLDKLTVNSAEAKELIQTTSQTTALLVRNFEGFNRQLESDKEELVEMIESRCRGGTTNGPLHNKLEIPTFKGAVYDKPMKFLNDLLQYFNAGNITQRMFKHIVRQSLRGPAGDWWELVQENVQTINDFKTRFTERYWCRQTQAKIRNQLEFGYYEAAGNL